MPADTPMVLVPRAVLEPIARAAGKLDGKWDDRDCRWNDPTRTGVTVAHIRAVAAALSASPIPTEQAAYSSAHIKAAALAAMEELANAEPEGWFKEEQLAALAAAKAGEMDEQWPKSERALRVFLANLPTIPSSTSTAEQVGANEEGAPDIEAIKKEAYKRGWNDREDDFLTGVARAAPSPGEGDAPVAWRALTEIADRPLIKEPKQGDYGKDRERCPSCGHAWHVDKEPHHAPTCDRMIAVAARREMALSHPTPATPEGLREKVAEHADLIEWLRTVEAQVQQYGHCTISDVSHRKLARILAALQPQAQGGE